MGTTIGTGNFLSIYQRLGTCGWSPKCMCLFHSAWSRYKSERRILFTAHFKKADRNADGFSKTGELNLNVKWNIDENALPQTVLILISTSLGWKRPIFCGCDIFHSYKTSRFLSDVYELHGKKKNLFCKRWYDSVQPEMLSPITCLHFGV